jgi:hypothetical protein
MIPKTPVPVSERMRLYRQRRRQGVRLVRIPLQVTDIDDLIHLGLLRQDERQDEEAARAAVLRLFHQALDGARDEWVPPWARAE